MSKRQNPLAVWQQIPVANRTVGAAASVTGAVGSLTTNNDKTGYSLTAGSYSVRASSTQSGAITVNGATTNTATISSVTTTRAIVLFEGCITAVVNEVNDRVLSRTSLTNATTVTATKGTAADSQETGFFVQELF